MADSHNSMTVQAWLGYLTVDEIVALKRMARELPENPVVINIGAGGGTSGLAFMESRDDLQLVTIDIRDGSSPHGCLEGERVVFASAGYGHPSTNPRWRQINGDSKEVGREYWQDGLVDMVFVDGDHSYEGCAGDIHAWMPHLRDGGIIAIHDYRKTEKFYPGVDEAVAELLLNNYPTHLHVDTLIAFRVVRKSRGLRRQD